MPTPKPLVQVACLCEKALIERDGVASLIRIFDTVELTALGGPNTPFPEVSLTGFVGLKAYDFAGDFFLGVSLRRPNGKTGPRKDVPIKFPHPVSGVNTMINITVKNPVDGLYWFDLFWGDEPLSSIPIRFKLNTKPVTPAHDQKS